MHCYLNFFIAVSVRSPWALEKEQISVIQTNVHISQSIWLLYFEQFRKRFHLSPASTLFTRTKALKDSPFFVKVTKTAYIEDKINLFLKTKMPNICSLLAIEIIPNVPENSQQNWCWIAIKSHFIETVRKTHDSHGFSRKYFSV